jgi:hypothetical protein
MALGMMPGMAAGIMRRRRHATGRQPDTPVRRLPFQIGAVAGRAFRRIKRTTTHKRIRVRGPGRPQQQTAGKQSGGEEQDLVGTAAEYR